MRHLASHPVARVAGNVLSLLTSDVLNRATTFLLYILVAHYMDPHAFGQLSLALVLFYTFQVFSVFGLPTLITRAVAKDRTRTSTYWVHGSLLALLGSLISIALLSLFVRLMSYATDTASIVLLLSLGLVPYALSTVCESVVRGWERMHLIALAHVPTNIAKVVVAYALLDRGAGLREVTLVLVGTRVAILLVIWALLLREIGLPRVALDINMAVQITRSAATFLGIDALIAIWSSLSVVLLSKMASETEAGLFNAAAQLLVPFTLLNQSITGSVFPLLCRQFGDSQAAATLKRIADRLIEVLLIVAVPGALALFHLADSMLVLIYGNDQFGQAATVLRILAATVVLKALTGSLGQVLFASLRERLTLRIVIVDVIAAIVLSVTLISRLGIVGAPIAVLLTKLIDFVQHYVPVARLLPKLSLGLLAWKSCLAALAMLGALALVKPQNMAVIIPAGAGVYGIVLAGLIVLEHGGVREFRARYLG